MAKFHRTTSIIERPDIVAQRTDNNANDVNINDVTFEYDVVIVGGGTAGCVLASRLSENPDLRILMLETGGRQLFGTHVDYGIFTEPQTHAGNVKKYWPRAKVLGGCSAINAMMFTEGAPSDYDEWAKTGLEGAEEWSYQALRKYFLKFEKYNPGPDDLGVNLKERGWDGPVDVGRWGSYSRATIELIKTWVNLGIPLNPDVNSPTQGTLGVTQIMTYIDKHKTRVTAETAYLTPEVLHRPNLFIAIYSTATRIIFVTKNGAKRAVGLEFADRKDPANTLYRVKIRKELILAAGAIHSPHLLMLSGIGAESELEKHGISVIQNLPGVGRALQDHPIVPINLGLKSGYSDIQHLLGISLVDKIRSAIDLIRWLLFKSGPMTTNIGESAAFICSNKLELDNHEIEDETPGLDAPDIEMVMMPLGLTNFGLTGMGGKIPYPSMTMGTIALKPQSRGVVSLKTSNPFDAPSVDPHYLEKHNDVIVLVRGLKFMMKAVQTDPLASIIKRRNDPRLDHGLDEASDEELENLVRKRVQTIFHPTSTCRMGKLEDEGVVDARLKVHGLDNVRVVDASVFTRIPAGHPIAVVYAVAEKAADMIKQDLA